MKQKIFTLVLMLAMVFVASSAWAQTAVTPYQGGTYTYTLSGIELNSAGTGRIILNDNDNALTPDLAITGNWSVPRAVDQDDASLTPTGNTNYYGITVADGTTSIEFDITYAATIPTGLHYLYLELSQTVGGCTNFIKMDITVAAIPTLSLAISGPADFCQAIQTATAVSNNTAASSGMSNTFTFTVTPTFSAGAVGAGATADFTCSLNDFVFGTSTTVISIERTAGDGTDNDNGAPVTSAINVTGATGVQTFTVTFNTTTGLAAETITGQLSNGTLNPGGSATNTYPATYSAQTDDVVVNTTPSIGTFTY